MPSNLNNRMSWFQLISMAVIFSSILCIYIFFFPGVILKVCLNTEPTHKSIVILLTIQSLLFFWASLLMAASQSLALFEEFWFQMYFIASMQRGIKLDTNVSSYKNHWYHCLWKLCCHDETYGPLCISSYSVHRSLKPINIAGISCYYIYHGTMAAESKLYIFFTWRCMNVVFGGPVFRDNSKVFCMWFPWIPC